VSNNQHLLTIPIDVVDLGVEFTVNNSLPVVGGTVVFTLNLTNHGDGQATDIEISVPLAAGLSLLNSQTSQGSYNSASGVWSPGQLAPSGSATLTLTAEVNAGTAGQMVTLQAAVQAVYQTDTQPANDTDDVSIWVNGVDLSVAASVSPSPVSEGENVTYTVQVSNLSNNAATNVEVTAALPPGLTFVSSTTGQGAYDSASGVWQPGTVNGGGQVTLSIVASVNAGTGGTTVNSTVEISFTGRAWCRFGAGKDGFRSYPGGGRHRYLHYQGL
jgi:uncharacterized repeat protein (TIGR01451 family)